MQVRYTCVGVFWGWAFRFRWTAVGVAVVPGNVWRVSVVPRVTARVVGGAVYCLMSRSRGVLRPRLGCRFTNCFVLGLKTSMMVTCTGLQLDLESGPSGCAVKWLKISRGFR